MVIILDTVQTQYLGQRTYFRQQIDDQPYIFPGTGVENCSYWQVQCRTDRLNPRWQLAIIFETLYFGETW